MEIVIVVVVLLLLFGPSRIPKMARGLGSSFTEFRKGFKGVKDEADEISSEVEGAVHQIKKDMSA
jgi:sec-independent protein translocase protein TatA